MAEIKALAEVLEEETNQDKTTEEICGLLIDALDGVRSRSHRVVILAQLSYPEAEDHLPLTLAMGPYGSRQVLDTPSKWKSFLEAGSSARTEGMNLAWDNRTGRGTGRFMLAPLFRRPTDAWSFYPKPTEMTKTDPMNLLVPPPTAVSEALERYEQGLWAREVDYGPACHCGLLDHPRATSVGPAEPLGRCPKHDK